LKAVHPTTVSNWITEALRLEKSVDEISDVKQWLRQPDCDFRKRKKAFKAEEVMEHFKWSGWKSLGIVKAALHDLCSEKEVVVVSHGTPNVYSFTFLNSK
jgi:hypothetical protein